MNNDPSVPRPSLESQHEFSGGFRPPLEWNNGISRRSFLKRTGGATVASIVAWHGLGTKADAADPPKAQVPLRMIIVIPDGEEFEISDPDSAPQGWVTLSDFTTMNSGETLSSWHLQGEGHNLRFDAATGKYYASGPATFEYTREKQ